MSGFRRAGAARRCGPSRRPVRQTAPRCAHMDVGTHDSRLLETARAASGRAMCRACGCAGIGLVPWRRLLGRLFGAEWRILCAPHFAGGAACCRCGAAVQPACSAGDSRVVPGSPSFKCARLSIEEKNPTKCLVWHAAGPRWTRNAPTGAD